MVEVGPIASPSGIRQRNELAAMRALYRHGRLSRAELARILGLNRSSSGHIITGLTADGLVREVGTAEQAQTTHAGRPGIMLELMPEAAFFLGIEIGVEHITVVEVDLACRIVNNRMEPFDGPSVDVETAVSRAIAIAFDTLPAEHRGRCEGLGVAVPAQMDKKGLINTAPLLGWQNIQLADLVRAAVPAQMPVIVENDANAFATGASYGAREVHSGVTLYLVMESGVGGGIVVDGIVLRGARGLAGEIGHLRVDGADAPGRSLESVLGLECILSIYRSVSMQPRPNFATFLADVRDRVPGAVAIAEDWARALAYGLIQACRIIDADRVVLGGSVAALYPLMAARVLHHIRSMQEESFPLPLIETNDDETVGPAFGAACMLHQRFLLTDSARPAEDAA
ncbi:Sugar kinase of the NBD/HSP70 family, may contain an N-terminal HTH domain [Rhizobium mongolense subsp. loessense]|uniref:Sugar kinase of the NBD/HSP70 family, may contain an N-terminal HTH domain n=1 Tax=Rhizobium mongolense subsp. loessense TaxID=158890 RepID=A0A1G4RYJ1_9HYPH|nr:ROK family transcriptional regulator [Rhizobium mongolense]SCW62122.1 Sugar kinase of the NBD/HSP70 family, may contain an N-terminal HTH domain [Rhizobium mongolense subsp. loessense]